MQKLKRLLLSLKNTFEVAPALLDLQSRSLGIADLNSAHHTAFERESLKF
jgi:hypothetical protein